MRIQLVLVLAIGMPIAAHGQDTSQLTKLVEDFRNQPDLEKRKKIIEHASQVKPAPSIPEEARRHFVIGAALFKDAKSLRAAYESTMAFAKATDAAPWWADAYYNLALAAEIAGMFERAEEALGLYLLSKPAPQDRREALDKLYGIEAAKRRFPTAQVDGLEGLWEIWQRRWIKRNIPGQWEPPAGSTEHRYRYEIRRTAAGAYTLTMLGQGDWLRIGNVSGAGNQIRFDLMTVLGTRIGEPSRYDCRLQESQLVCITRDAEGEGEENRFVKRSHCERVGEGHPRAPSHYPVLCR